MNEETALQANNDVLEGQEITDPNTETHAEGAETALESLSEAVSE